MARKKLSEFAAKKIFYGHLGLPCEGLSFDTSKDSKEKLAQLDLQKTYVVKVDEGVKKRMKNGLIALNKKPSELFEEIQGLQKKGYTHFLIEPFLAHKTESEKYVSVEQVRDGLQVLFSHKGGIDIEENQDLVQQAVIRSKKDAEAFMTKIGMNRDFELLLKAIKEVFEKYYFSFVEINPLIIEKGDYSFLDLAAEVDNAGEFFVNNAWSENDLRSGGRKKLTGEEQAVQQLAAKSQAAFSLEVLNPDGGIFMLLSGGGASIVLADEVYNQSYGKELANYGEYSGNPSAEETYLYTQAVLRLLIKSKAKQKVLVIAGGVANFTDVRITFKGLIKALDEVKGKLKEQHVKVFVRRGGPYQEEGLSMMKTFLDNTGLLGAVEGPEMVLTHVVDRALESIPKYEYTTITEI